MPSMNKISEIVNCMYQQIIVLITPHSYRDMYNSEFKMISYNLTNNKYFPKSHKNSYEDIRFPIQSGALSITLPLPWPKIIEPYQKYISVRETNWMLNDASYLLSSSHLTYTYMCMHYYIDISDTCKYRTTCIILYCW